MNKIIGTSSTGKKAELIQEESRDDLLLLNGALFWPQNFTWEKVNTQMVDDMDLECAQDKDKKDAEELILRKVWRLEDGSLLFAEVADRGGY
ncbi:hypothetical protein [Alkalicoccobacillus murimartini]|uniref:Uncharacterized protein n=1 Tax=Alkalicoccobacillus murimartini TaxID=171685 RepID=A0ABT9YGP8_9BACI|nr:hypothetical protein [Alkalicoccobacillus murimartini]MDQ0206861.1 hypothetical protein [Alkalicoccobacillus murimartini]